MRFVCRVWIKNIPKGEDQLTDEWLVIFEILKPPFWALHTDLLVQTTAQLSAHDKKCSIETFLEELKNVEY
jgi:hypothetical protein